MPKLRASNRHALKPLFSVSSGVILPAMPINAFCISADKHKLISKIYNRDLILLQPYSRCIQKNQVFLKSKNRGEKNSSPQPFCFNIPLLSIIAVLFGNLRCAAFFFSFFSLPVALVAYHLPYIGGHSFKVVS